MAMATRACRESAAMKRAVQSLGCRVQLSSNSGDVPESFLSEAVQLSSSRVAQNSTSSFSSCKGEGQQTDKADFSVSISAIEDGIFDGSDSPLREMCESLCPFRSRDGCKWPDAGCAQLGSQFVGLKANFDAFDRLSIYDCYFGSK